VPSEEESPTLEPWLVQHVLNSDISPPLDTFIIVTHFVLFHFIPILSLLYTIFDQCELWFFLYFCSSFSLILLSVPQHCSSSFCGKVLSASGCAVTNITVRSHFSVPIYRSVHAFLNIFCINPYFFAAAIVSGLIVSRPPVFPLHRIPESLAVQGWRHLWVSLVPPCPSRATQSTNTPLPGGFRSPRRRPHSLSGACTGAPSPTQHGSAAWCLDGPSFSLCPLPLAPAPLTRAWLPSLCTHPSEP